MHIRLLFLVIFLLIASGCQEKLSLPDEVARVNGDPIFFADLEALRVTFIGTTAGEDEPGALSQVQWQYRRALQQLVGEQLVAQQMKKKKLALPDGAVEQYEAKVRRDYAAMDFDAVLLEQGISLEAWRRNIYRMLLVEKFVHDVLRPSITIAPEEVEAYYAAHKSDFSFAEQWHFLQISSPDKSAVDAAKTALLASKNATAVQQRFSVAIRDIRMAQDRLPADVGTALASLASWQASSTRLREGDFTSFVLVEKNPSLVLDLVTTYDRVEQVLEEEKLQKVFVEWVNGRMRKADILIHPALLEDATRPANATRLPDTGNATGDEARQHNGTRLRFNATDSSPASFGPLHNGGKKLMTSS